MKIIITISLLILSCTSIAQEKKVLEDNVRSYIKIRDYEKLTGKRKSEIPIENYKFRNGDTLVLIPNNYKFKNSVPYEPKDSTFLEIYKDIVYKKYSKDTIRKKKLYMRLWKKPIKIYFSNSVDERYKKIIKRLSNTINKEVDSLKISFVSDLENSNYVVYEINEDNKYKYSKNLPKNKYIDFYNYWNRSRIYDTKLEINTTKHKNKTVNVNYLIQLFIKSLGHFNTTYKVPCKSIFSKCNSDKKRFRKEDLEILKYHYSYGICKFTGLKIFEENHKKAKEFKKLTGKNMNFIHID